MCCPCGRPVQPLPAGPPDEGCAAAPAYEGPGQHTDPVPCSHQRLLHPPGPGSPPKAPVTAHVPAGSSRKENQDPGGLEGFISIQLHSQASRFLISHLTFKDRLAGPLAAACLAEPRRAARRSRSGAAAGPSSPSLQPPEGDSLTRPPRAPPAGAHSQPRQPWWAEALRGPDRGRSQRLCRGGQPGPERAVVWPRSHSKALAPPRCMGSPHPVPQGRTEGSLAAGARAAPAQD